MSDIALGLGRQLRKSGSQPPDQPGKIAVGGLTLDAGGAGC